MVEFDPMYPYRGVNTIAVYGAPMPPEDELPGVLPFEEWPIGPATADVALLRAEAASLREVIAELCKEHPRAKSVEVVAARESGAVVVRVSWRIRGGV